MKKLLSNVVFLIISVVAAWLLYAALAWFLRGGSRVLGREGRLVDFFETMLVWISPWGLGYIILPLFTIFVFLWLKKRWGNLR